jgi:aryl-alcohol dehydrogenase-like predicted oxidoreductase
VTADRDLRTLGRTGLRVSPIGLGLAALGRPGYINLGHGEDLRGQTDVAAMERNAHEVLRAAYDGGVRYFDAARSYGKAEAFLASWLAGRGLEADDLSVGSKWGYTYTAGWRVDAEPAEVKDLSAATLRRQAAESRTLLGPHLRLYQIHSATVESGVLEDREVLDELAALRAESVAIGFTATGPRQADTIDRGVATGAFDTVQATWNLHERSAGAALARAHEAGMGVIVKEAVANGRLTDRAAPPQLAEAAAQRAVGTDALAIAAVLAQPWVDVVLSGAASVAMLESNFAALDVTVEPDFLADLAEPADDYWSTRAELAWN